MTTLRALANARRYGMTWRELGDACGWHHGQASGALSALHRAGRVARLREQRAGSGVYVLPNEVHGRDVATFGRGKGRAGTDFTVTFKRPDGTAVLLNAPFVVSPLTSESLVRTGAFVRALQIRMSRYVGTKPEIVIATDGMSGMLAGPTGEMHFTLKPVRKGTP